MSSGSELQGGGGLSLEQRVTKLEAFLRGGPGVVNALGASTDGQIDLGSALNKWRDLFATGIVIGSDRVDVASLAGSAAVYVFDATDATFEWPGTHTKCFAIAGSGVAGSRTTTASSGGDGGATTVTIDAATLSSAPGGRIARSTFGAVASRAGWRTANEPPGNATSDQIGLQTIRSRFFDGLSHGDEIDVQIGAGGAAGSGAGAAAGDDGFAILFAFG